MQRHLILAGTFLTSLFVASLVIYRPQDIPKLEPTMTLTAEPIPQESLPDPTEVAAAPKKPTRAEKREQLFTLLHSTDNWRIVNEAAVELQNLHDPKALHEVFQRLDALGRLDDSRKLPWISKKLFARYVDTHPESPYAVRVVAARPELGTVQTADAK